MLATKLGLSDEALEITKKDGAQLFMDRVQWARLYLAKTAYIGSSKRGVWSLTEKGRTANSQDNKVADGIRDHFLFTFSQFR